MGVRPDDSERVITHSSPELEKTEFPKERKQLIDVAMARATLSSDKIWWIYGNGYDLSRFVERHPGGKEAILLGRGRDCTAMFESYHIFSKDHWYVRILSRLLFVYKEVSPSDTFRVIVTGECWINIAS